jgi:dihydrofolate reductase
VTSGKPDQFVARRRSAHQDDPTSEEPEMRLTVHEFISLDGVVTGWFSRAAAVLFGRTTFELMRGFWPDITDAEDPVARALNTLPKYVVSTALTETGWEPTTILRGDPVEAVARLKDELGDGPGELQVHGCARLAATLHAARLVDEYRLLTFPVTLGAGKRLFTPDAPPTGFRVLETRTTSTGGVYAALEPTAFQRGDITVEDGREVTSLVD